MRKSISLKPFQSTLLQEERRVSNNFSNAFNIFQSTLLQEERRQKCTIILILICNNYCIVSIKSHQHYNNYFMQHKKYCIFPVRIIRFFMFAYDPHRFKISAYFLLIFLFLHPDILFSVFVYRLNNKYECCLFLRL